MVGGVIIPCFVLFIRYYTVRNWAHANSFKWCQFRNKRERRRQRKGREVNQVAAGLLPYIGERENGGKEETKEEGKKEQLIRSRA